MATIKEVVTEYLIGNGYDGLFNEDGECACELSDLMPCSELNESCEGGYKGKCDCENCCEFHIFRTKENR